MRGRRLRTGPDAAAGGTDRGGFTRALICRIVHAAVILIERNATRAGPRSGLCSKPSIQSTIGAQHAPLHATLHEPDLALASVRSPASDALHAPAEQHAPRTGHRSVPRSKPSIQSSIGARHASPALDTPLLHPRSTSRTLLWPLREAQREMRSTRVC